MTKKIIISRQRSYVINLTFRIWKTLYFNFFLILVDYCKYKISHYQTTKKGACNRRDPTLSGLRKNTNFAIFQPWKAGLNVTNPLISRLPTKFMQTSYMRKENFHEYCNPHTWKLRHSKLTWQKIMFSYFFHTNLKFITETYIIVYPLQIQWNKKCLTLPSCFTHNNIHRILLAS